MSNNKVLCTCFKCIKKYGINGKYVSSSTKWRHTTNAKRKYNLGLNSLDLSDDDDDVNVINDSNVLDNNGDAIIIDDNVIINDGDDDDDDSSIINDSNISDNNSDAIMIVEDDGDGILDGDGDDILDNDGDG